MLSGVPAAQAELRAGPNHRLSSDPSTARAKDMPSLAVNPANPQHIVETNADYLDEGCEASASFDGGQTWSAAATLRPPANAPGSTLAPFAASCLVASHAGDNMFQGVSFGSGNTVYATSGTPRALGTSEQGGSVLIYKSTDGGVTWGLGVIAIDGASSDDRANGPNVIVNPGAGPGGADIVYSIVRDRVPCADPITGAPSFCAAILVATSTNSGQTFSAPVQVSSSATQPTDNAASALGGGGSLNITWRTRSPSAGAPGEIQFVRSTNQGATFTAPVAVTLVTNIARTFNSHVTPLGSTGSSFPRIAANKTNGNLYIVYNQGGSGPTPPPGGYTGADHFIAPDSAVWFQRSVNGGTSWSTPKRISEDAAKFPGTQIHQTRHPDVSVAPSGRVDIVWHDRRHWYQGPGERTCLHAHLPCDDPRLGDTYYSFSNTNGTSFSANKRISDHSHNNDVGIDYRFGTYWNFGPALVAQGAGGLLVGWMDSREGNFDNDNQDIYLSNVNHDASGAVPQTSTDQTDPVALSVALSRRGYKGGGEGLHDSGFASRNGTRVVIVNKDDVAGALAGAVLARANLSPVLLSSAGGLSDSVKAEIARLNPAGAFIVGDSAALSDQVFADVVGTGVAAEQVDRVSGAGDAGTAAAVAAAMDKRSPAEKAASAPAFDAAVIANPAGPHAVAAAGLAAARRLPILYVNATGDALPASTSAALSSLNINKTLVVGPADQVSSDVRFSLPNSERLGESTQFGTSKAVARESVQRGLPSNVVFVANGDRPMDAALLGAVVGRATGIMLLAPGPISSTAAAHTATAGLQGVDQLVLVNESAPAASVVTPPPGGGTPPPPPTVIPGPPPPPTVVPVVPPRRGGKLSARVTPSRDLRTPYVFRTSGKLTLPSGMTRLTGCSGRVSVQVKRGNTTISTRRVTLSRTCTYSSKVTFTSRRRFASFKRLKFTARFLGNTRVAPVAATPRFAQVRR